MVMYLSGAKRIALVALSPVIVFVCFCLPGSMASEGSLPPDLDWLSSFQRCGDDISFFFIDQEGKSIDPATFESINISGEAGSRVVPFYDVERKGLKGIWAQTGCGFSQMRVTVTSHNREMELILKRIPADQGHIFLYSLPFREGTYMFDFEYDLDKNCEDQRKGWHAECLISPQRIKKVTSEKSNQGGAPPGVGRTPEN